MTKNEFKLYCILFCEKYKGKTFGEVLPDVHSDIINDKIELGNMHISKSNNMYAKKSYHICLLGAQKTIMYMTYNNRWINIPDTILKFEDTV